MKRFYNIQIMEDLKRNTATDVDKEIVFSKAIKEESVFTIWT